MNITENLIKMDDPFDPRFYFPSGDVWAYCHYNSSGNPEIIKTSFNSKLPLGNWLYGIKQSNVMELSEYPELYRMIKGMIL